MLQNLRHSRVCLSRGCTTLLTAWSVVLVAAASGHAEAPRTCCPTSEQGKRELQAAFPPAVSGQTSPKTTHTTGSYTGSTFSGTSPLSLTAVGAWTDNCTCCGGGAMGYVSLKWQAIKGATSYILYRNGVRSQVVKGATSCEDMTVDGGKTYTYAVSAMTISGKTSTETAPSAPVVATVPKPPAGASGSMLTPPTNLRVTGLWQAATSRQTDKLTWDARAGAVSYNVYRYDVLIAKGVTGTNYTVPDPFLGALSYTVTAVDAMGMESIPSNLVTAQGAWNPSQTPWYFPGTPGTPTALTATPEWNNGAPRIALAWDSDGNTYTHNVYRDGKLLATGVWGITYTDASVAPGESHVYAVSAVNVPWTTPVESAKSTAASAIALLAAPPKSSTALSITGIKLNEDSALISFNAIPGARDYRVYNTANPGAVKYSAGSLSIEMNGLNPAQATTLVVEAVDKLGPYQKMDGDMGPGAMSMSGAMQTATNGQGDPSNVPNVLATSTPFSVKPTGVPRLTGSQVFFDTFRNSEQLTPATPPAPLMAASSNEVTAVENNKWTILNVQGDLKATRAFIMGNHFMDTLYDGGTWGQTNVLHNNNAVLVMQPKATADISNGRVLHVTYEVDAHFNGRRWCDVLVAPAGDPLLNPGKFSENNLLPTASGKVFRYETLAQIHTAQLFYGMNSSGQLNRVDLFESADQFNESARIKYDSTPLFNGTTQDIDKRHRFDLYLSATRCLVYEEGVKVLDKVFPNGATLPFTKAQVYFLHKTYHTANDHPELMHWYKAERYWISHRPWADERHWDNMGFEVLNSFPTTSPAP